MEKKLVYIGGFKPFSRLRLPKTGVFIAHDFFGDDEISRNDYRTVFEDGFVDSPYIPVYAPIQSGTILETLVQSLINTDAAIFDLSANRPYNANVLIELGIALGLNHPSIVIAKDDGSPLLDFLESFKPLRYKDENDLVKRIKGEVDSVMAFQKRLSPYYCVICGQTSCDCRKNVKQEAKTYLLVGDKSEAEVERHLTAAVRDFQLKRLEFENHHATVMCAWIATIRRCQFAFFYSKALGKAHHGEENAATMIQLGMAVGTAIPWRIIVSSDEVAPTDVSAYMSVQMNQSAVGFRGRLKSATAVLMGEHNPFHGIYDPLEPPLEMLIEEEGGTIDVDPLTNSEEASLEPIAAKSLQVFISYSSMDREITRQINDDLNKAGINTWFDVQHVVGGSAWALEIEKALRSSELLILILSQSSVNSKIVHSASSYFLDEGKQIIPVMIENVRLPRHLRMFQNVDFVKQAYDSAMVQLINTIRGLPEAGSIVEKPQDSIDENEDDTILDDEYPSTELLPEESAQQDEVMTVQEVDMSNIKGVRYPLQNVEYPPLARLPENVDASLEVLRASQAEAATYTIWSTVYHVGRGDKVDLRIPGAMISNNHFSLYWAKNTFWIVDTSLNQTWLRYDEVEIALERGNPFPLEASKIYHFVLARDDTLVRFQYVIKQPEVEASLPPLPSYIQPSLRMISVWQNVEAREFEVNGNRITIGREKSNMVVLSQQVVSRQHAEIIWKADAYYIKDTGSLYGIQVDGNIIPKGEERRLSAGQRCSIVLSPRQSEAVHLEFSYKDIRETKS